MKPLNSLLATLGHNITAEFYPYADIKHTIRRRNGRIYMRISDVFCDAPEEVLLSLGRILLAKLTKKRISQKDRTTYYEYVHSDGVQEKASKIAATRKRRTKIIKGLYRDLEKSHGEACGNLESQESKTHPGKV